MAINPQQKQQGTGFTNLQQLMAANQGNKLGQAVGGGIQQTGQQVQQGLQKGQQDFQNQAQAGQLGTQAQKENVENTLKDPSQVSDQNVADFAKYRAGQYSGPQDISNIDALKGQAQQAQQMGQAIGTEGGRQSLLQRYAAGPGQYGAGAQRLDTLLLGSGGGNDLQQARRSVSGLNSQVSGAQQAAQQQAQQYTQQAKGFGQQVSNQVSGKESGIYNPAQQQAQQANITEQQNQSAEQAAALAAQNNQLSQAAIKSLGLTAGQRTYGANLGQFMGYQGANEQANALNVMGQPQLQQYQGLQKLMGQTPSATPQTQYQAGQATFDKAGLQAAMAANQAQVDPVAAGAQQAQQIANLAHQRDALGPFGQWTPQGQAIQAQISALAPGAAYNGYTRTDWANSNLQTAMQNLANINAKYAGNVSATDNAPLDMSDIQTTAQNLGQENMPTVS